MKGPVPLVMITDRLVLPPKHMELVPLITDAVEVGLTVTVAVPLRPDPLHPLSSTTETKV